MEMKKILVADTSIEFCDTLVASLSSRFSMRSCCDGLEAQALLQSLRPDVLVMDLALPHKDGITLLKEMEFLGRKPAVILTTRFISPYIESLIRNYQVDFLMVKPCSIAVLTERILDLTQVEDDTAGMGLLHNSSISAMLMELNIPCKRRGFAYLEACIRVYMEEPGQSLTKCIYPRVAKLFGARVEAVERGMRQVIHETWVNRDDLVWRRYFSAGRNGSIPRPTNAEMISRLAEIQKQSALKEYA